MQIEFFGADAVQFSIPRHIAELRIGQHAVGKNRHTDVQNLGLTDASRTGCIIIES